MTRLSVVVPSSERPAALRACLAGLHAQSSAADELVVVRREHDRATAAVVREQAAERLVEVTVTIPGLIAAMKAGARKAGGDIIAFTDDDAVPRPDWIERLRRHFADPAVGGVGGRDELHPPAPSDGPPDEVGRVTAWGKVKGNHHGGAGPAREVAVLKGCNIAFRREALAFPHGLRGSGAQVHNELAMCLWARNGGWRIVYDPALVVDHYPAPRPDGSGRGGDSDAAVCDAAYNLVAGLVSLRRDLLWRRAVYGLLLGDRAAPGVARAAAAIPRREPEVVRWLSPSLRGQAAALWDVLRGKTIELVPVGGPGDKRDEEEEDVADSLHASPSP